MMHGGKKWRSRLVLRAMDVLTHRACRIDVWLGGWCVWNGTEAVPIR